MTQHTRIETVSTRCGYLHHALLSELCFKAGAVSVPLQISIVNHWLFQNRLHVIPLQHAISQRSESYLTFFRALQQHYRTPTWVGTYAVLQSDDCNKPKWKPDGLDAESL